MSAPATIRPGTRIVDDGGRVAQLHGVGIQRCGDRWFAWGEDKTAGALFTAVSVYSTEDFASWRHEGIALRASSGELAPDRVVERPKALQRPDGRWVLFLHLDSPDYAYARVGYAIADLPVGPYAFVASERPLGNESRDIGVYQEGETGYLLSEDRAGGLRIYRLRPDFLGVDALVATLRQQERPHLGYESPALVRHDGLYYLFGSDLTGWDLNDNVYATAPTLSGPWSPWRTLAPIGSRTFDSQVSAVVSLGDGRAVYVGDRWTPDDLCHSPLVTLPLRLGGGHAELSWRDAWTLEDAW